jgi:AcrR family transcriptional regulator
MPRPIKPILSRRRIAEAALALIDEEGFDALTTRRLARRLGVQGPSLYNHIASRDALIDDMHALIAETVDSSTLEGSDWRTGLAGLARSYRAAFVRHPHVLAAVLRRPIRAETALGGYDRLFRFLLEMGWPAPRVAVIVAAFDFLILGSAIETFADGFDRAAEEYADDYPSLAAVLSASTGIDIDGAGFELGLEGLLGHLDELRSRPSADQQPTGAP